MLWPEKMSFKEFDNENKICPSKIPLPLPHNFPNGPSLKTVGIWQYCFSNHSCQLKVSSSEGNLTEGQVMRLRTGLRKYG